MLQTGHRPSARGDPKIRRFFKWAYIKVIIMIYTAVIIKVNIQT